MQRHCVLWIPPTSSRPAPSTQSSQIIVCFLGAGEYHLRQTYVIGSPAGKHFLRPECSTWLYSLCARYVVGEDNVFRSGAQSLILWSLKHNFRSHWQSLYSTIAQKSYRWSDIHWHSSLKWLSLKWRALKSFAPSFNESLLACITTAGNKYTLAFALVGGGVILPPLWFFEDNSKTKGTSVTKLGIPFHWSILHLLWNFCVGVTSGQVTRSSHVT